MKVWDHAANVRKYVSHPDRLVITSEVITIHLSGEFYLQITTNDGVKVPKSFGIAACGCQLEKEICLTRNE